MNTRSIAGEPIRWQCGESATPTHRNLTVIVWVAGKFYMHCRPVPVCTPRMSKELWRAKLRRNIRDAAEELRRRVYGRVHHA